MLLYYYIIILLYYDIFKLSVGLAAGAVSSYAGGVRTHGVFCRWLAIRCRPPRRMIMIPRISGGFYWEGL